MQPRPAESGPAPAAISGPPRTVYFHDPEVCLEEDLIAEVQIPVRKP